jgi:thioredoxin 1
MRRFLTLTALALLLNSCQSKTTKIDDDDSSPLAAANPVSADQQVAQELPTSSDASFAQDVLNAKVPVFVDFNTSWCVPCKLMEPTLMELATEYKGKMKFVSIDAEKNPIAAQKFSVSQFPTFLIFMNGKVEQRILGAKTKLQMDSLIAEARVIND